MNVPSPEYQRIIDALAETARAEIKRMAQSARRSIGQQFRRQREAAQRDGKK